MALESLAKQLEFDAGTYKGQAHVGLPVLRGLEDEVVERLTDLSILTIIRVREVNCAGRGLQRKKGLMGIRKVVSESQPLTEKSTSLATAT